MEKFNPLKFINKLSKYPERQLENERLAAADIAGELEKRGIGYRLQKFSLHVPKSIEAVLEADGKKIKCENSGFLSGRIKDKNNLISSLAFEDFFLPNINFNPYAGEISRATHYFAPAVSIARKDVGKIMEAKTINARTKVRKVKHASRNILSGNAANPKVIFFSHYDSVKRGAVDNASGTAAMLGAIISDPGLLKSNLFVFSGAEELSYEKPVYWGAGYRAFESKYLKIMEKADEMIIVDMVGYSRPLLNRRKEWVFQAFPIKNLDLLVGKTGVISGKIEEMFRFYHSSGDSPANIKTEFMDEAIRLIAKKAAS